MVGLQEKLSSVNPAVSKIIREGNIGKVLSSTYQAYGKITIAGPSRRPLLAILWIERLEGTCLQYISEVRLIYSFR